MFKGRECSLCGGKLVRGICTECGLDNTRTRMYQESEFLSEDEKDQMYQRNHTEANKKFFDDLKKEDKYAQQEMNKKYESRPPYGSKPPMGARPPHGRGPGEEGQPKKQGSVLKYLLFAYVAFYIISMLLNMMNF